MDSQRSAIARRPAAESALLIPLRGRPRIGRRTASGMGRRGIHIAGCLGYDPGRRTIPWALFAGVQVGKDNWHQWVRGR